MEENLNIIIYTHIQKNDVFEPLFDLTISLNDNNNYFYLESDILPHFVLEKYFLYLDNILRELDPSKRYQLAKTNLEALGDLIYHYDRLSKLFYISKKHLYIDLEINWFEINRLTSLISKMKREKKLYYNDLYKSHCYVICEIISIFQQASLIGEIDQVGEINEIQRTDFESYLSNSFEIDDYIETYFGLSFLKITSCQSCFPKIILVALKENEIKMAYIINP